MGLFWWLRRTADSPKADKAMLAGNGRFDVEVVSESHAQQELQQAARERRATTDRVECLAVVFPCDTPHDSTAVAVMVDAAPVGHLSGEDAVAFRQQAKRLGIEKGYCRAVIIGGSRDGSDEGKFEIKLDLKRPVEIATATPR